ncbi:hypothetical protein SAMN05660209_00759 [Geodermatophilus africanus]|uniref:Tetratricopeptide repeat-containing protein n=2 Tax=Geodermatophilus africanus TaxID=1137993 RepID=A0A1H3CVU4_9ACTN|nr:hypothetical protein SAMN05660209_00759 [Geodermatophilus africanus]
MQIVGSLRLDAETPEAQRAWAAQLVAWAADRHPEDSPEVTPAALLIEAGETVELLGDHPAALDLYRRAAAAEGTVAPDARCYVHRALVATGELPSARRLAEEVRRSAPADTSSYAMIGETWEKAGDLVEAHRWMNLGLRALGRRAEGGDPTATGIDLILLLIVRRRLCRALELPPDAGDRLAGLAVPR